MNRSRVGLLLCAAAGFGCGTVHSAQRPPQNAGYVEVGPIQDQNGIDIGPVVATRMRELRVADAHTVTAASGKAEYVEGTAKIEHDTPNVGTGGGAIALQVSGITILVGGVATGIVGSSLSGNDGDTLKTISTDLLMGGAALLVLGIVAAVAPPPGKAHGTVDAKLILHRPKSASSSFTVQDRSTIYFKRYPDLGLQNLDGLANGMSSGLLQLNHGQPAAAPAKK